MIPYAHVLLPLVLGLVVSAFPAHAQEFDVRAPLAISHIVVKVDEGIIDRRFVQEMEARLRAMFMAPVDVMDIVVAPELLEANGTSGRVNAAPLLNAFSASIDWEQEPGTYHVLLIAQEIQLPPDSFNFSVSMGGLSQPSRVGIVSLSRLQKLGRDRLDEAPHRTAVRVQKLVARSIVWTSGYQHQGGCLLNIPRGLSVLDALPESFCEPNLSNWIAAGLLRAAPR